MSNHYNAETTVPMETQNQVNREKKTQKSIASGNNSHESYEYLPNKEERAHQQNKISSDDEHYEPMKSYENTTNSQSSDSYETKNFTTIQKKYQTSEECRFWNNGQCTKQNCRYQHFSLKPQTLSYYLLPKTGNNFTSRKIGLTKSFSFQYRPERNSTEKPTKTIVFVMKMLKFAPTKSSKNRTPDIIYPQK